MYCFDETPFTMTEVEGILEGAGLTCLIQEAPKHIMKNVVSHFRQPGDFDFPNFFDIVSFIAERLKFDECDWAFTSDHEDEVFEFVDYLASCLNSFKNGEDRCDGNVVEAIAREMLHDPCSPLLRKYSEYGAHILENFRISWPLDEVEVIFCSVTAYVFHRSLDIILADEIEASASGFVRVIEPSLALVDGKFCQYIRSENLAIDNSTPFGDGGDISIYPNTTQ